MEPSYWIFAIADAGRQRARVRAGWSNERYHVVIAYIRDGIGWPIAAAVVVMAIGIPLLHAARRKQGSWTAPERILAGYVVVLFGGLLVIWGAGHALRVTAPTIFESWGSDFNAVNPIVLFMKILFALPLAFGVSSVVYGFLGGWRHIVLGFLGIAVAGGLAAFATYGALYAACYGWSSCP